jgi:serine/threonine protein phosphatase PrpC
LGRGRCCTDRFPLLQAHPAPDNACQALIAAANKARDEDNITAVVIDFAR